MGWDELLGNERLKENLQSSIRKGRTSHFYLISGPAGSGKHTLARILAAAILCRAGEKPCMDCPACRKVMGNTHPDFITVVDPEHKTVPVKMVRQVREDMFIKPNEGEKKIYLFPQELGTEGQNALLKVLEEPPSYGVYILLTDNPEKVLTTVRSRAVELALQSLPQALLCGELKKQFPQAEEEALTAAVIRSGGYLGQAKALLEEGCVTAPQTESFAKSYATKDAVGLTQVLVPMEKWKRDQFVEMLNQWQELLQNALVCRSGMPALSPMAKNISTARSSQELLEAIRHLQKATQYAQGNVSVAAICSYLAWVLR